VNYSSRFWLFAPLAMLLALALWAAVHWWVVAAALDQTLNARNGREAAPGIRVSYAKKTISGFPFNIDVVFDGLTLEGEGAHGPFRWSTDQFALHRLTYGPAQDIYEAAGNQSLSWTDGGGQHHAIKFLPGSLRASAGMDGKGLARFDLDMVAAGGSAGDGVSFTAAHAQLHFRRDPGADAIDLQVSGDGIDTNGTLGPFGHAIKALKLYLTLTDGSAFAPLLAGKESWGTASDAWQQHGGRVSVGPVAVSSERLSLDASAVPADTAGLRTVLDALY
jgi:hypothetical protein